MRAPPFCSSGHTSLLFPSLLPCSLPLPPLLPLRLLDLKKALAAFHLVGVDRPLLPLRLVDLKTLAEFHLVGVDRPLLPLGLVDLKKALAELHLVGLEHSGTQLMSSSSVRYWVTSRVYIGLLVEIYS